MSSFENPNVNDSFWSISVTRTSSASESERRLDSPKPPNPAPRITTCVFRHATISSGGFYEKSCGQVGDEREAEHAHAGSMRGDRIEHGRQPDDVRSERAVGADLGGRLVVRPQVVGIDALHQ